MALKILGVTVVNDTRYFNSVSSADTTSERTLLDAVKLLDHKLIISNSGGTVLNTFYGANTV